MKSREDHCIPFHQEEELSQPSQKELLQGFCFDVQCFLLAVFIAHAPCRDSHHTLRSRLEELLPRIPHGFKPHIRSMLENAVRSRQGLFIFLSHDACHIGNGIVIREPHETNTLRVSSDDLDILDFLPDDLAVRGD